MQLRASSTQRVQLKSVRQQLLAGSLTNYMPASYLTIQSPMHKRLGFDFPGCLRGKFIAERPELLTPPDLFEAFKLHNSKKYKEYIHLMSELNNATSSTRSKMGQRIASKQTTTTTHRRTSWTARRLDRNNRTTSRQRSS
jgi:hypothetical protein